MKFWVPYLWIHNFERGFNSERPISFSQCSMFTAKRKLPFTTNMFVTCPFMLISNKEESLWLRNLGHLYFRVWLHIRILSYYHSPLPLVPPWGTGYCATIVGICQTLKSFSSSFVPSAFPKGPPVSIQLPFCPVLVDQSFRCLFHFLGPPVLVLYSHGHWEPLRDN